VGDVVVERELALLRARPAVGLAARADRAAFLADHAEDLERVDLLRRAERVREVQVRTAALDDIPDDVTELLGPPPVSREERSTWKAAVVGVGLGQIGDVLVRPLQGLVKLFLGRRRAGV